MLNPKQKKCLELMVRGDMEQKEIAEEIKVSEQTICNWKKSEEFCEEYSSMLRQSINALAARAFRTQVNLLSARSEMVRYTAAKDILDRAGFVAEEKLKISGSLETETSKLDLVLEQLRGDD